MQSREKGTNKRAVHRSNLSITSEENLLTVNKEKNCIKFKKPQPEPRKRDAAKKNPLHTSEAEN